MNKYEKTKRRGNSYKRIKNSKKGITLVALVVTIVILIILATVTINMAFGDNGLVKYAEEARDKTANSTTAEAEGINSMVDQFANVMAEDSEIPLPDPYVDNVLPTAPKLSDGMTPVKYEEGTGWVKTNEYDNSWYNYANKEWANIVLGDATFIESGDKEILDEEKAYSMLVWIPRYAYQITSGYHQSGEEINPSDGTTGAGNINIVFIDTANKNKEGTTTYSEVYPKYATGSGMEDYVVHPAFNYGGTKLSGFWVGKYEASSKEGNHNNSTGDNTDSKTVQIKAGVSSWRYIEVSNIHIVCTSMNNSEKPYGLNLSDSVVDPHMIKNSEWGAVAYLSQNTTYGKGSKVWINPNSNYITGQAGTTAGAISTTNTYEYSTDNGQQASTTGNTTGIYDINGGAYEYVAGYVNNGSTILNSYGSALLNANERYKDVYNVTTDNESTNYNNTQPTSSTGNYGDAIYEVSKDANSPYINSWYNNYSMFPFNNVPFFRRGGANYEGNYSGVFNFSNTSGYADNYYSFRVVITILQ